MNETEYPRVTIYQHKDDWNRWSYHAEVSEETWGVGSAGTLVGAAIQAGEHLARLIHEHAESMTQGVPS